MRSLIGMVLAASLLFVACSGSRSPGIDATALPTVVADASTPETTPELPVDGPGTPSPGAEPTPATGVAPEPPADSAKTPGPAADPAGSPPNLTGQLTVEIVEQRPHDPSAFTQGLVFDGATLLESTGLNGRTTVRRVDAASGEVLASIDVADEYFGEGLELVDDRLIQLTYLAEVAFVYDAQTLELVDTLEYSGQGWGLCQLTDGRLVRSDGTSSLTFHDPDTFLATEAVQVTLNGESISSINELECVGETIWANLWKSDFIVGIDPTTGVVTATVDASELDEIDPADEPGRSVLNGIAYSPDTGTFLLTGKQWSTLFEVRFVPVDG